MVPPSLPPSKPPHRVLSTPFNKSLFTVGSPFPFNPPLQCCFDLAPQGPRQFRHPPILKRGSCRGRGEDPCCISRSVLWAQGSPHGCVRILATGLESHPYCARLRVCVRVRMCVYLCLCAHAYACVCVCERKVFTACVCSRFLFLHKA